MTFRTAIDLYPNSQKPPLPSKIPGYAPEPAKNNIIQNLTENAQNEQANNTQNHEAIIMLPTATAGRINGKKKKQSSALTNSEYCINYNN